MRLKNIVIFLLGSLTILRCSLKGCSHKDEKCSQFEDSHAAEFIAGNCANRKSYKLANILDCVQSFKVKIVEHHRVTCQLTVPVFQEKDC